MRSLITAALIGGLLAVAMSPALVRAAITTPQSATQAGLKAGIRTVSSSSTNASPSVSGTSATREVPVAATMPAPAAGTYVNFEVLSSTKFYPHNELYEKVTGCVVFGLTIGPDGYPLVLSLLRSWPPGLFDAAALAAAPGFRIRITDRNGHTLRPGSLRTIRFRLPMIYWIPGATPTDEQLSYMCAPLPKRVLIVSAASINAPQKITIRPAVRFGTRSPIVSSSPRAEEAALQTLASDFVTMPVPTGKTLRGGWVRVGFCVGADGRATESKVEGSSPGGLYDQAALAALSTWTFLPRKVLGRPVKTCRISYTIPVIARSDLEREPVALRHAPAVVNPRYLDNAQQLFKLHRGLVTLRFCVNPDGSLDDVGLVEPGSSQPFAAAAVDVLYSWQFLPSEQNGKPVRACNVEQTLRFLSGYDMLNHNLILAQW